MKIYYDAEVDALYIELRPMKAGEAECRDLNEDITANYDFPRSVLRRFSTKGSPWRNDVSFG